MRTTNHKIKRFFQGIVIKTKRIFKMADKKARYPKTSSNSERTAAHIFLKVLHHPDSKLYYDLVSNECYLRSDDSTLYLFLESNNLKVINSVYGYDIRLSTQMEIYLSERFRNEMAKRRKIFKSEAISKVKHSLDQTLEKINEKYSK